jgi:hypothetical protein
LIGTFFWFVAELLAQHPSFWTATFGWSLILSNLFALPLMSVSGLYLEQTAREDFTGIFSFIVLSYILTPFQAYAAVKGLLEKDESGWVRTLKTGSITDRVLQVRVRRLFSWILPRREIPRRSRREAERRRRVPSALALIFLILMSSIIAWVAAAAIMTPEDGGESIALSLEYLSTPVDVNGITTHRILTHPNFTSLGTTHTDSFVPQNGWRIAWGFYLYGPLEEDYRMRGVLNAILYLYASDECDVEIRLEILDVDESGKAKKVASERFDDVELDDSLPSSPVELSIEMKKSRKFEEGHSILVEILFKTKGKDEVDGSTVFLAYDSISAHSRIEFPGIVMPESLLPLVLIVPLIPLVASKARKRRNLEYGGII